MTVLALDLSSPPLVRFWFHAPCDRLNMNDRGHWSRRQRLTKYWRTTAWGYATAWALENRRPLPPCLVRVTFGVPDRRRRDPHNTAPTVKAIIDGMVSAGFWPDDTPDQVAVLDPRFAVGDTSVIVECWAMGVTV